MSRSGYSDDDGDGRLAMWRGAVRSAIRGKRGQAALRELLTALDAMPEKALAAESLVTADGEFCTLGVLGAARGIDMKPIDPEDWDAVADAFGLAPAMVREIVYENDETVAEWQWVEVDGPPNRFYGRHRPSARVPVPNAAERRWRHMRDWVASQIRPGLEASETPAHPTGRTTP